MLIKLPEWVEQTNLLSRPYRGKVIANDDPNQQGRVKVEIKTLIEGAAEVLPWCYPLNPTWMGGSNATSFFAVPDVGSELTIEFPFDDIYFPFYVGYWHTRQNVDMSQAGTDYPSTYGWSDAAGNRFTVNRAQGYMEVVHASGSKTKYYQNGDVETDAQGDVILNAQKAVSVTAQQNITLTSQTKIIMKAPAILQN